MTRARPPTRPGARPGRRRSTLRRRVPARTCTASRPQRTADAPARPAVGVVELPAVQAGHHGARPRRSMHVELPCQRSTVTRPGSSASVRPARSFSASAGLDAGDHVHDGRDHARGVAGGAGARAPASPRAGSAGRARRCGRTEQREAVGADAGAVHPGRCPSRTQTSLTQEARLEVVGAVEDEVGARRAARPRCRPTRSVTIPRTSTSEFERAQVRLRRRRLGHAAARRPPRRRATGAAGSTPRRSRGRSRSRAPAPARTIISESDGAERAAAHDHHARRAQRAWPSRPMPGEQLLPRVARCGSRLLPPGPGTAPPTS